MASVVAYTGLAPQIVEIETDADATAFVAGDLVSTSSGTLVAASTGAILGIALKSAITDTDDVAIPVELINLNEIYVMKYSTVTAESIIGTGGAITFTLGAHTVTTSGTDVYIVGLHPEDAVGLSGGRVLVRFDNSVVEGV